MIDGLIARILGGVHNFPALQQIAFVRRTFWQEGKIVSEGRYFLTSLPRNRLSAKRFLEKVTSHWEIENSLHNVKDKHMNEDKQYTVRGMLGCIQSSLRSLSLNALRTIKIPSMSEKTSLSAKAMRLLAKPLEALKLMSKI